MQWIPSLHVLPADLLVDHSLLQTVSGIKFWWDSLQFCNFPLRTEKAGATSSLLRLFRVWVTLLCS